MNSFDFVSEAHRADEDFKTRLDSLWNKLPEDEKRKIQGLQSVCVKHGIVANPFEFLATPVNIL